MADGRSDVDQMSMVWQTSHKANRQRMEISNHRVELIVYWLADPMIDTDIHTN